GCTFRVPYPLGFFQRLMDGRIDDPDAGWKGRGPSANFGTHLASYIEGGKGTKTKMVNFQLRPDPLAYGAAGAGRGPGAPSRQGLRAARSFRRSAAPRLRRRRLPPSDARAWLGIVPTGRRAAEAAP